MTVQEALKKYKVSEGTGIYQGSISVYPKPNKKDIEWFKAHKPEVLEAVRAQEAQRVAVQEAAKVAKAQKVADIAAGRLTVKAEYREGEYLAGYTVYGEAAVALEEIGAAKHIAGWGYLVNKEIVEALGAEFTLSEAAAIMKPATENAEAKKAAEEQRIARIFALARESGLPAEITRWTERCDGSVNDCSMDIVIKFALPDGSTKTERIHTH